METDGDYNRINFFCKEGWGKNGPLILNYNCGGSDKRILVIPLYGTIIDKINILKNLVNIENYEIDARFAIYSGIINADIKKMCDNLGMKPVKSLKFVDKGIELLMALPRSDKIKFPKNLRRSREEIRKDILDTISGASSLNITHIIYRCNLNYEYALRLLLDMVRENILEANEESSSIKYKLTTEGFNYLSNLKKLKPI